MLAVTVLVAACLDIRWSIGVDGHFLLLAALAAVYAEATDRIERIRRYLAATAGTVGNASSLWCFAAALALPPAKAGLFAALLYGHTLVRAARNRAAQPHRLLFTAATEVLAAMAASAVVVAFDPGRRLLGADFGGAVWLLIALSVYALINQSLVTAVVYLVVRPDRFRSAMLDIDDELVELATLTSAILLAETLLHSPLLTPLILVLSVMLRRSSLVRHLQVQATRDPRTGLLNPAGWRSQSELELDRTVRNGGTVAVLMLDLDNFKRYNDTYGHPAGDAALRAIADCMSDALRGYDAIGRYGGEEFVAFLPDVDAGTAESIAARVASRVRAVSLPQAGALTASVGIGYRTAAHADLDELVVAADSALYAAKRAGRDRVVVAPTPWTGPGRGTGARATPDRPE